MTSLFQHFLQLQEFVKLKDIQVFVYYLDNTNGLGILTK